MATGLATKRAKETPKTPDPDQSLQPYLLTVEQYVKMIGADVFSEGERVELLGGRVVHRVTEHDPHNFGVDAIAEALRATLPEGWFVRQEKSIVLDGQTRPEPDIAVVRGPRQRYRNQAPRPKDIAMIVEVADSSYSEDRGERYWRYAEAKIPAYAILNARARRYEFFTKPWGRGNAARYRATSIYTESDSMPVMFQGREIGHITVRDIPP